MRLVSLLLGERFREEAEEGDLLLSEPDLWWLTDLEPSLELSLVGDLLEILDPLELLFAPTMDINRLVMSALDSVMSLESLD